MITNLRLSVRSLSKLTQIKVIKPESKLGLLDAKDQALSGPLCFSQIYNSYILFYSGKNEVIYYELK